MGILDVFLGSLNLISIIFIFCGCLVGVLIGILLKPPRANRVFKFLRNDKRFIEFDIDKEYAYSVYCKDKKGYPPHRFIKNHSGFTGKVGSFIKRAATIFLGVPGVAYTQPLEGGKQVVNKPLVACLRSLWGDTFYDQIPEEQRVLIDPYVLTTIDLGKPNEVDLKIISEQILTREQAEHSSKMFFKGREETQKGQWVQWIFIAGTGAIIMMVAAIMMGWIKIAGA